MRREEGKLKERIFFWALLDVDWEDCTLWKAHPNSLHCKGWGGRKESWRSEDSLGFHRNHSTE